MALDLLGELLVVPGEVSVQEKPVQGSSGARESSSAPVAVPSSFKELKMHLVRQKEGKNRAR